MVFNFNLLTLSFYNFDISIFIIKKIFFIYKVAKIKFLLFQKYNNSFI